MTFKLVCKLRHFPKLLITCSIRNGEEKTGKMKNMSVQKFIFCQTKSKCREIPAFPNVEIIKYFLCTAAFAQKINVEKRQVKEVTAEEKKFNFELN